MKLLLLLLALIQAVSFKLQASEALSDRQKIVGMLNHAAKTNNIELVKEYRKYGGNLNIQDEKGYSPLIYAAYYGHDDLVSYLIAQGAEPCLEDKRGNTALMGAIFKGNLKSAYILMNSECSIQHENKAKQNALMYAALFDRKEIVKALMKKGLKANQKDHSGESAISLAEKQMNHSMLEILQSK